MTARLRIIVVVFFAGFLIVIARLFYWQVVKAQELSALGKSQYGALIRHSSTRGEIRTADQFPIAANKISYTVFANPKEVKDVDLTSRLLAPMLEKDEGSMSAVLSLDRFWVALKTGVDPVAKAKIEKLNIVGIGFEQELTRFYPEASMAAHLIGFVGKNEAGEDKGYFGIEGYYDLQLRGKGDVMLQVRDALGRPILSQMSDASSDIPGRSVVLSIDRVLQYIVEKKLKEGIDKYQAAGGMVGIIDPKTGSVLSMASYPSFDPATYYEFEEDLYKNPFISNTYEPGSTFKALVMSAGLDAKVVKHDTKCPICDSPIEIGGYEIRTWNNEYNKDITMRDTIMRSDNIGMVYVAQSLGLKRMLSYLEKFGIGSLTGIDVEGETAATIRDPDSWYPIDLATAGFGQGISVTPIQLLTAFSAIANNGTRMEPHIVSKIITNEGKEIDIKPKVVSQAISPQTAKIMTEILVYAVDKGEAKWTKVKGYRIAGKTGTAQIPIAGHYDPNKTVASFIGFAPANDPKFAMLVIVDRPTTSVYGSETAAPIFFNIAKDILAYYNIAPTEEISKE